MFQILGGFWALKPIRVRTMSTSNVPSQSIMVCAYHKSQFSFSWQCYRVWRNRTKRNASPLPPECAAQHCNITKLAKLSLQMNHPFSKISLPELLLAKLRNRKPESWPARVLHLGIFIHFSNLAQLLFDLNCKPLHISIVEYMQFQMFILSKSWHWVAAESVSIFFLFYQKLHCMPTNS
jgi:hypothetical protein